MTQQIMLDEQMAENLERIKKEYEEMVGLSLSKTQILRAALKGFHPSFSSKGDAE